MSATLAAAMVLAWFAAPAAHAAPLAQASELTPEALANATYIIDDARERITAQLKDGSFSDEAKRQNVTLGQPVATGDLNGDGAADAVVPLVVESGGSGTFTYIAAVLNDGGKPRPVDVAFIGDRIRMQRIGIDDGTITVRFLDRRFDQPMSARPTIPVAQTYQLKNDQLVATDVLSGASLRHATYLLPAAPDGQVFLVNGRYTNDQANISAVLQPNVRGDGDLNADGSPDAAVILNASTGADSVLAYLEAVLNVDYQPRTAAAALLGDRVRVTDVAVKDGLITVTYFDRKPDEPMSARPTVETTKTYRLDGSALVEATTAAPVPAAAAPTAPVAPQPPQLSGVLTGTVTYMPRIALPPNAVVTVLLEEVSRADAPATVVASQTIATEGKQVPIPFELKYDPAEITQRGLYTVRARIMEGEELTWISTQLNPVLSRGNPVTGIEVMVQQVGAPVVAPAAPAAAPAPAGAADLINVSFTCADGATLAVVFDNTNRNAVVTFEGQSRTLKQQPSASGIRYADDTWVLLGKGSEARLLDAKTEAALTDACLADGAPAGPSMELTGSYVSGELPAADASGRYITLTLASAGAATLTTQFVDRGEPIVESGTWAQVDGNAVVTLAPSGGATQTLTFQPQGNQLVLLNPVEANYGTAGLTLTRVGAASAAPALSGVMTGTVTYRVRIMLPPTTDIVVTLYDAASGSEVVSTTVPTEGKAPPYAFDLSYDPAAIDPAKMYTVGAKAIDGGQTLLATAADTPVLTSGDPVTGIELELGPVPAEEASVAAPQLSGVLTGTVTYRQRIALPPNAVVEVKLSDVSRMDVAAIDVATQTIVTKGEQVPIAYELKYDPAKIDPRMTYAVSARITVDGKLAWINDTRYSVLTRDAPATGVEIVVIPVR